MVILQDSRENKPLQFTHPCIESVRVGKLNVGDYTCEFTNGEKSKVVFERKSLGDLFGTLSQGYERFKKEIERAHECNTTLYIIIEGTLTRVARGYNHSRRSGLSIIAQLMTLLIKYNVHTVFCKDRKEMVLYITEFYRSEDRARISGY